MNIFFHFELRSDPEPDPDPIFFQLSRIRVLGKKIRILISGLTLWGYCVLLDFTHPQFGLVKILANLNQLWLVQNLNACPETAP